MAAAPPTVLVLVKGLGIGGAEKLIAEGARFWDRERYDYRVAYVLPWKDQLVPDLTSLGVPVACLGSDRGMTPGTLFRLRRHLGDVGADLVHAHLPSAGIAARMVSPVPVVYTEHNLAGSYRLPTRVLNRLTYRRNAAVTAVSSAVADSVDGYPGPTARVVPNGVSVSVDADEAAAVRRELGLGPADPLVVHVGNIRPGKGHATLIEAARLLPADVTVVSIGAEKWQGDLDRVRSLSASAGLGDRMRFLGRRPDALSFIAAADVYVNPADVEGLPVTILEAMALGTPVVATAVGGVPSLVRPGETGTLVSLGDPTGLADAIDAALRHSDDVRRLAAAGQRLVESEYGLEPMIRTFEKMYDEVLA